MEWSNTDEARGHIQTLRYLFPILTIKHKNYLTDITFLRNIYLHVIYLFIFNILLLGTNKILAFFIKTNFKKIIEVII